MNIKKLLLLFLPFFLTGCYDYQEITDLGIIVALGIDYQNDKYIITYELLEDNKDKQSGITSSYTVSGEDKILAKAFEDASSKIAKKAYYSHIDIVLFSQNIVSNHFQTVTDYLLRDKDLREDFNIVIVDNPQNILGSTNSQLKVIGSNITKRIKAKKFEKKYSNVITDILMFGKDTSIPIIDIQNDNILITGLAIFHNYNYVYSLDNYSTDIYMLIINNTNKVIMNSSDFSIAIYNTDIKIDMNKKYISLKGTVNAEIIDNPLNYDIKDEQVLKKIEDTFSKQLNNNIKDLIEILQNNNSDILGITNNYYQKKRIKNNKLWLRNDIKNNIKVKISKKGIIYEVKNDK